MKIRLYSLFISTDKASGAPAVIPASDFQDPADYNRALASLEVRGLFGAGTTSVTVGIETATDLRNPDGSPTSVMTARTSNGVQDPKSTPDTISMADKQAWRFVYILSSSSGVGGCFVSGWGRVFKA